MSMTDQDVELHSFLGSVQPRLSRLALMLAGERATAEDLVQETMIRVARRWALVEKADDREAYACRIALNCWRDTRRRVSVRPTEVLTDRTPERVSQQPPLEDAVLDKVTLHEAMARLTVKQRTVLYFRYYEQRSVRETARLMECSEGTVKSQTSYALRVLSTTGIQAPVKNG